MTIEIGYAGNQIYRVADCETIIHIGDENRGDGLIPHVVHCLFDIWELQNNDADIVKDQSPALEGDLLTLYNKGMFDIQMLLDTSNEWHSYTIDDLVQYFLAHDENGYGWRLMIDQGAFLYREDHEFEEGWE